MFFPFGAVNSRAPVERRRSLPRKPRQARFLGEQVHLFEAFRDCETPRSIPDDHDVIGFFHHRLGQPRNILDAAHRRHGTCAPSGAMHHAGIQLHFTFLIGQAAIADGIIFGIVFHDGDRGDHCIERVPSPFQNLHALIEGVYSVGTRNDKGPRPLSCWCVRRLCYRARKRLSKELAHTGGRASRQRSQKKPTACPVFHRDIPPRSEQRPTGCHSIRMTGERKQRAATKQDCNYSEAPSGRKYCVPLTGSCSLRSNCCRSSLRSTKSISEVLMTSKSDAA